MNKDIDISKQLNCLIEEYDFNINTLSQYLMLNNKEIQELAKGNVDFLLDDNQYRFDLFNKISFLYDSAVNDKDVK